MNAIISLRRLFIAGVLVAASTMGHATDQVDPGVAAAQSWLALVDAKEYGKSWAEAASFFRSSVSEGDWERALTQARAPLGEVQSRALIGARYATALSGAPPGEYVVVRFKTRFAGRADVIETVSPMEDEGGVWRVSGYYIK